MAGPEPVWVGRNGSEVYRVGTVDYGKLWGLLVYSLGRYRRGWEAEWAGRYSLPGSLVEDVRAYCSLSPLDLALVGLVAAALSWLRVALTRDAFLPLGRRLALPSEPLAKLPESLWKLCFYSLSFMWSLRTLGRERTFWDPLSAWDEWGVELSVGWDIGLTYLVQAAFYVHSVHATLFLDQWRKDSSLMLVHHLLTLALLAFSYSVKQHQIGALVLLLHDVTDVLLEFTKVQTYLKWRGGRRFRLHEWLANVGFAAFAVCWFVSRLYWFPLKVLYAAVYGGVELGGAPSIPFVPLFAVLLSALLLMNLWWFTFILLLLYKVATGQVEEVQDLREDGATEDLPDQPTKPSTLNGHTPSAKRKTQ